jgi:hypothetical protein
MVSREGLCTVDARLSVISSRAEKRVTKDGVLPLRLDFSGSRALLNKISTKLAWP